LFSRSSVLLLEWVGRERCHNCKTRNNPRLGFELDVARAALIKVQASVGRHLLFATRTAPWASQHAFDNDVAHF
jgi:hypothetical protein